MRRFLLVPILLLCSLQTFAIATPVLLVAGDRDCLHVDMEVFDTANIGVFVDPAEQLDHFIYVEWAWDAPQLGTLSDVSVHAEAGSGAFTWPYNVSTGSFYKQGFQLIGGSGATVGTHFDFTYTCQGEGDGWIRLMEFGGSLADSVTLHQTNPIPEPASIALFGLSALWLVRRR